MMTEEAIKAIKFANEFLKVTYGLKKESDNPNIPFEVQQEMANIYLDHYITNGNNTAEDLLWGLVNVLSLVLRVTEMKEEDLSYLLDAFVEYTNREEN